MSFENCPNFVLNLSEYDVKGEEHHFYRFKSFRLDVAERRLLHHNLPVPLTPKAFDVLALLVERGGHLVEKDELMNTVWADSFVEEQNITRTIHTLRKVLGKDENGSKFIETVAKKGYRFVAKVTEITETSEAARTLPANQKAALSTPVAGVFDLAQNAALLVSKPKQYTRIFLFAVGFLSAVFLIVMLSFNFKPSSQAITKRFKSIAVLPVQPLTAENRDVIYEFGIADALTLKLGAAKNLIVRPLSATRQYADITQDALAAGRELQVDYVLASNYQLADGKIRITAQLFNIATGQAEETSKSEKDAGNIFAMQDAIADKIGNIILARLSATESNLTAKRGTTNEEAYQFYLQGRNLTYNRTSADTRKAIEYFEQAIRLDPNFARAYSGMAHAYIASGNLRGGSLVDYEKAKESVTKALELDNNLAEGYAVSGELKFTIEWNYPGAETDLLRAIEIEPNSDLAHDQYASFLAARGRFDEALAESKTALEINPNSFINQLNRGRILYLARRYDEAILQFKGVMEVHHDLGIYAGWLWVSYELKGEEAQAYEWFMKIQKQTNPELVELFETAYETAGWRGVRQKVFELKVVNEQKFSANYFAMARQCALLGHKEQAFEYLNKAIEKRQGQIMMLKVEPTFDLLRGDPRFDELVRRVGLE